VSLLATPYSSSFLFIFYFLLFFFFIYFLLLRMRGSVATSCSSAGLSAVVYCRRVAGQVLMFLVYLWFS
jgi:hypothetical protein